MQLPMVEEDQTELLLEVRGICKRAYRLRDLSGAVWGVRDWSRLRFSIERVHARKLRVVIDGALGSAGLQHFVDCGIGRVDVDVECRD